MLLGVAGEAVHIGGWAAIKRGDLGSTVRIHFSAGRHTGVVGELLPLFCFYKSSLSEVEVQMRGKAREWSGPEEAAARRSDATQGGRLSRVKDTRSAITRLSLLSSP